MKVLQDLILKYNPVIAELKIPSRSEKRKRYAIRLHKDGTISHEPDCVASSFRRECRHIKRAKELWNDKYGYLWNL